jgi:hypothetical protein
MEIKQFKLANNDELICEIVAWNNDETDDIIVRRVLKIVAMEDIDQGMRYYTLKPWMSFEEDPDAMHAVSSYHIIGSSNPGEQAMSYYYDVLKEMKEHTIEEMVDYDYDSSESNVIMFDPSKHIH